LEDEASQLYEIMVNKSENPQVSLLLDKILQETRTHRELMKHISKITRQPTNPPVAECERKMGTLFANSIELIRSIKNQVLNGMPIAVAAAKLMKFEEEAASEEDLTQLYVNVKAAVNIETSIKHILAGIAEDERNHVTALKLVVEMSDKK